MKAKWNQSAGWVRRFFLRATAGALSGIDSIPPYSDGGAQRQ